MWLDAFFSSSYHCFEHFRRTKLIFEISLLLFEHKTTGKLNVLTNFSFTVLFSLLVKQCCKKCWLISAHEVNQVNMFFTTICMNSDSESSCYRSRQCKMLKMSYIFHRKWGPEGLILRRKPCILLLLGRYVFTISLTFFYILFITCFVTCYWSHHYHQSLQIDINSFKHIVKLKIQSFC